MIDSSYLFGYALHLKQLGILFRILKTARITPITDLEDAIKNINLIQALDLLHRYWITGNILYFNMSLIIKLIIIQVEKQISSRQNKLKK